MVAPAWQGQGVGAALLRRLEEYARQRGVRGFTASIPPHNARMQRLAAGSDGTVQLERDADEVRVTILCTAGAAQPETLTSIRP
jgi:GNAT superfamily N-acetyltransferase